MIVAWFLETIRHKHPLSVVQPIVLLRSSCWNLTAGFCSSKVLVAHKLVSGVVLVVNDKMIDQLALI